MNKPLLNHLSSTDTSLLYRAYNVITRHRVAVALGLLDDLASRVAENFPPVETPEAVAKQQSEIAALLGACPVAAFRSIKLHSPLTSPPELAGGAELYLDPLPEGASLLSTETNAALRFIFAEKAEALKAAGLSWDSTARSSSGFTAREEKLTALRAEHNIPGYGAATTAVQVSRREATPSARLDKQGQRINTLHDKINAQAEQITELKSLLKLLAQHVGVI